MYPKAEYGSIAIKFSSEKFLFWSKINVAPGFAISPAEKNKEQSERLVDRALEPHSSLIV